MTNITIQWDRVDCLERNGETESYRVVYYPTSDSSDRSARTVAGTGDSDRMFTVTGLPPRTNYTFEIQASNFILDVRGAAATVTVSTSAPQSEKHNAQYIMFVIKQYFVLQALVFSLVVNSILTTVL